MSQSQQQQNEQHQQYLAEQSRQFLDSVQRENRKKAAQNKYRGF